MIKGIQDIVESNVKKKEQLKMEYNIQQWYVPQASKATKNTGCVQSNKVGKNTISIPTL